MKRKGRDLLLLLVCGVMVACFCKKESKTEHTFDKTHEEEVSAKEKDKNVWDVYEDFLDNREMCYLTEEFCTYDREQFYGVGGKEENFKEGQAYFLSGLTEKFANRYDNDLIGEISFAAIDCGMDGIEELALRFEGLDDWSHRGLILIFCVRDGKLYLCHEFEDEDSFSWGSTELFYSGYMIDYFIHNDEKIETHSCIDGKGDLIFWYKKEFSELWRLQYLGTSEEEKELYEEAGIRLEEGELDYTQKKYDLYQPVVEGYLEAVGDTFLPEHAGVASYYVDAAVYGALYSNRHQEDYFCVDHAAGEFFGDKDLENFCKYCMETSPQFKERGACTEEQMEEILEEQAKELGISGCIAKEPLAWIYISSRTSVSEDTKEVETEEKPKEEPRETHRYEFIVRDVTWQEAYDDCISRGGYLVNINSQEEYETICQELSSENLEHVKFWIGGKRDLNRDQGHDYYWVDKEGNYGEKVHDKQDIWEPGIWEQGVWLSGEPSIWDKETHEPECFMDMYYQESSGRWVWNDVPLDISMYYAGSIGYICEYEP